MRCRDARRRSAGIGAVTVLAALGLVATVGASATAAKESAGCSVVSASRLRAIFGTTLSPVTPAVADRPTLIPGGIATHCRWKAGTGLVALDLFGPGRGAKGWKSAVMFDELRPRQDGATEEKAKIPGAEDTRFVATSGGDRLAVRSGDFVVDAESTLDPTPGASETQLVALAKAALAGLKPSAFTSSSASPAAATASLQAKLGTRLKDVTYCTVGGIPLKLDLYYPTSSTAVRLPVVVYIHGGQLIEGDKAAPAGSQAGGWLPVVTGRGFVFVSINYRLAPANKFPAMVEDSKCAIRYLRANADQLGLDADRMGVTARARADTWPPSSRSPTRRAGSRARADSPACRAGSPRPSTSSAPT
jgi:hypothetical protein